MPQFDRYRSISIPIEFTPYENLSLFHSTDRITFVLVTDGKAVIKLNDKMITIISPCVMCLSSLDKIQVIDNSCVSAQSFSISPTLLNNFSSFRNIKNGLVFETEIERTKDMLMLFFLRNENYNGIIDIPSDIYLSIFEWLSIIGAESIAQSDRRWTCRIKTYFLRILNHLDEIYSNKEKNIYLKKEKSPVDRVMEYLHTHYMDEITLDKLCKLTHTNRTSLNSMYKSRTGQTIINYLLNYRLRIATELLVHTGLTLDEIAQSTGFVYGTYFIKQFTKKKGMTPTEYKLATREKLKINYSDFIE